MNKIEYGNNLKPIKKKVVVQQPPTNTAQNIKEPKKK